MGTVEVPDRDQAIGRILLERLGQGGQARLSRRVPDQAQQILVGMRGGRRQQHVAQYYTPQGADWQRWNTHGMPLNPVGVPRSEWTAYYQARLRDEDYGVIALFYSTGFSSVQLPASMLLFRSPQNVYEHLLGLVGDASGEPGLPALTQALQHDPAYRPVAVGRFDSAHTSGLYVIWQKRAPA